MNKARLGLHAWDNVLNHVAGHKSGVADIYKRASYLDEKSSIKGYAPSRWTEANAVSYRKYKSAGVFSYFDRIMSWKNELSGMGRE